MNFISAKMAQGTRHVTKSSCKGTQNVWYLNQTQLIFVMKQSLNVCEPRGFLCEQLVTPTHRHMPTLNKSC